MPPHHNVFALPAAAAYSINRGPQASPREANMTTRNKREGGAQPSPNEASNPKTRPPPRESRRDSRLGQV
eukprot:3465872-Pyramimonas_sp.AAC.1